MNRNLYHLLLAGCCWLALIPFSVAQTVSNKGTEFWAVFPTHEADFDKNFNLLPARLSLFIASDQASSGTVNAGSFSQHFTVAANSVTEIPIPRSEAYIDESNSSKVLENKAIHILTDPGMPKVVAYTHIFAGQRSAASLLLPREALGQQYYSMNYQQNAGEGKNYIAVIATEPNTRIRFKRGNVDLVPGGVLLAHVNDVYEYLSTEDLTGVSVSVDASSGCNRFALFSGTSGVSIGTDHCTPSSLDPLYQQNYPVENWAKRYGFIPFSMQSPKFNQPVRSKGQYVRILAKDNATQIAINGVAVATLGSGQFFTTPQPLNQPAMITSNKPVAVAQYALSQLCSSDSPGTVNNPQNYSDPDMVLLNPLDYSINEITVYSSTKENITEQYLNILMKTEAAASFWINNQIPDQPFQISPNLPGYSYLQLNLNSYTGNIFHLAAADGFNAVAYGFGDVESYAYAAGTNLASTQSLTGIKTSSNLLIDSACQGDDFFFRLTLSYPAAKITWQMDPQESPIIQEHPTSRQIIVNDLTAYEYTLPKTQAYTQPGKHHAQVISSFEQIGNCNAGSQQIDYNFTVMPLPIVDFKGETKNCPGTISFTDQTNSFSTRVSSWHWNFGDGNNDTTNAALQNPVHTYPVSGRYTVSLTVTLNTGCTSITSKTIEVKIPKPSFQLPLQSCTGTTLTINPEIDATFNTLNWKWNFGDGEEQTSDQSVQVTHTYSNAGTYTVTLTGTSQEGCQSETVNHTIVIQASPIAAFSAPESCALDAFVRFSNESITPGNTTAPLNYLWDFGDAHATPVNPNSSTAVSPLHSYPYPGEYTVTLTAYSPGSCPQTVSKTIRVNGIQPQADFSVDSHACSGQPLTFRNLSKVLDYGRLVKLEWYFESDQRPLEKLTADLPENGAVFTHTYQLPAGIPYADYHIRLLAYSGSGCVDEKIKTVRVFASPQLTLDSIASVCQNSVPFVLTLPAESSGMILTGGVFHGQGVNSSGIFDPAAAGVGKHLIWFEFIAPGGCYNTVSRYINVLKEPAVNGDAVFIKAGESIILRPRYQGNNLSYSWEPADGITDRNNPYPRVQPRLNTDYRVTISNGGCTASGTISVHVQQPLLTSNTFTPNGDGVNDYWDIKNINDYPGVTVDIYNRNGTSVHHTTGYYQPWNGKCRGADVPAGVYYYVIQTGYGLKPVTGYVTVIR